MKILCVSDSHRTPHLIKQVTAMHRNADCLVFCGDGVNDLDHVTDFNGAVCAVEGNCDTFYTINSYDRFRTFDADGLRVGVTHGDQIGVKLGDGYAFKFAVENKLDILIYGHTHVPLERTVPHGEGYVYLFNPGSLMEGSFGLIQIKNGRVLMSHGNLFSKK